MNAPPRIEPYWPASLPCEIAIVGEAPGYEEARTGKPFIGESGKLLDKLLESQGIERTSCLVTNVFLERPPHNDVQHFFDKPKARKDQLKALGHKDKTITAWFKGVEPIPQDVAGYFTNPKYGTKGYLKLDYVCDLQRLRSELQKSGAKLVLALGNTALWALTGKIGISSFRGTWTTCSWDPSIKVMPTYHPAAVLREWSYRPIVQSDIAKLKEKPKPTKQRNVWVAENLQDFRVFERLIKTRVAFDVEEEGTRQITSFSISASPTACFVVDIFDPKTGENFWSLEDELEIWFWLKSLFMNPDLEIVCHNATYDLSHLLAYGIRPRGRIIDTMLLHHAYQPEATKSLGELASLYCNEIAWKNMRSWSKNKEGKAGA